MHKDKPRGFVAMKILNNSLYLTTPDTYVHLEGGCAKIRLGKEEKNKKRIPLLNLSDIVCFGRITCSTQFLADCAARGLSVSFLNEYGNFQFRTQGPINGNVLLRRAQYRAVDDAEKRVEIVRAMVSAKVANSRLVINRFIRDHSGSEYLENVKKGSRQLKRALSDLQLARSVDSCRGYEGEAAKNYFAIFDHLITKKEFSFKQRTRRPPLDEVNALLSFVYTLLTKDAVGALEAVGLDPAVGFLHCERPGRPCLALDLIEELRAPVADRLVLKLINKVFIKKKGFKEMENSAFKMNDETRKIVLVEYQSRKREDILHPFLKEKMPIGLLLHYQARLLARHLRGDLDAYPALFWK